MIGSGVRFGIIREWAARGDLAVACPSCGREAFFTSPYDYRLDEAAQQAEHDPRLSGVRWSRGFVVERFPDIFPWRDRDNPYTNIRQGQIWGVISCGQCGFRRKHLLAWPQDAYYRIDTPAGVLWAYTRAHIVEIRKYIAGDHVRRGAFDLNKLPKEFLLKRNRERVLRAVDEMLLPSKKRPARPAV